VIDENEPFTLKWKLRYTDTDPNGKANLKVRVYGREGTVYDHGLNYPDEKGPIDADIDLSYPWPGLVEGKYTAKVMAYGSGNSAMPVTYDFEVGSTPDRAKIIIR
jgi:hypothetical protein